ncbi:MAG: PLDc N-terminal domain-containing protein [Acidobacteriia bacterium]|nr:PLDc N-terminal domain-containing protein [Terriglobia bacterium]
MHKLRGFLLVLPMLLLSQALWAQSNPDDAAAAAGCFGCGAFMIFIFIAILALNIALLVWVAKDAKNRGLDNAVLWMILVMFTGLIGLVIYILARPQGNLIQCASCNNKRLQASAKCPHCGNA